MNTIRVEWKRITLFAVLAGTTALAQVPTTPTAPERVRPPVLSSPSSGAIKKPDQTLPGMVKDTMFTSVVSTTASANNLPEAQLDKAVADLDKGDKAASAQALQAGITSVEAEVQQKPSSFKDKILAQVGKLKTLLPLITGGGLGAGVLGKAVGLTKLASNAGRIENLLSAGSLIGKASELTGGLNSLGSTMSVLGGGASTGQSLVSTALASVSKLGQGGMVAKAAEPAVKSQIGSVLNFVKGAL